MNKFNVYIQFRTFDTYICENFFENLLELKRMQVFPLKLQYQKKINDFFKKKSIETYEFNLTSNAIVRSTLSPQKFLKNLIKSRVIAVEINLYL